MTEKSKSRGTWAYRGLVLILLTSMVGGAFSWAPDAVDALNNRTFTTPEMRVRTEDFINDAPTQEELREWKEHITHPGLHMPKEGKDSSYVRREEYEELIKNMAVDNYNKKRTMDEILENEAEMKVILDILLVRTQPRE